MYSGEHGVESRQRDDREIEKRFHSPFVLHAPIQWAIEGDVIKKRGGSNVLAGSNSNVTGRTCGSGPVLSVEC